jgi:hypothetical protein
MVWRDVFRQPAVAFGAIAGIFRIDVEQAPVRRPPTIALISRLRDVIRLDHMSQHGSVTKITQ